MRLLNLLQNRIWLTAGIDITGQKQHRDVVGRCCCGGSDHIGGAGADRGCHGKNLLALHLLCKGDSGLRHALLIFALQDLQTVCLLG